MAGTTIENLDDSFSLNAGDTARIAAYVRSAAVMGEEDLHKIDSPLQHLLGGPSLVYAR
jgi:hypothetical protein